MIKLAIFAFLAASVSASAQIDRIPGAASNDHPQITIFEASPPGVYRSMKLQMAQLPKLSVQANDSIAVEAARQLVGFFANPIAIHNGRSPASRMRDTIHWVANANPNAPELSAPRLQALGDALAAAKDVPSARAALDAAWDDLGPEADESSRYRRATPPAEVVAAKHYSMFDDFDPAVHPLMTIVQASPRDVRQAMMLQLASLPDISPFRQADFARVIPEKVDPVTVEAAKLLVGLLALESIDYEAIHGAFESAAFNAAADRIGWWAAGEDIGTWRRGPAARATEALIYWSMKFERKGLPKAMGTSAPGILHAMRSALANNEHVPSTRAALEGVWGAAWENAAPRRRKENEWDWAWSW